MNEDYSIQPNIMERRTVPELMDKKFFIPEYQRGYRWESKQIVQLLEDLLLYFESDSKADFYCLQPIVIKPCNEETIKDNNLIGDGWYEVIDGQQRLTTIRILCSIYDLMNNQPGNHQFSIHYSTRPSMDNIYDNFKVNYNIEAKKYEFVEVEPSLKNSLDSVYINNAAKTIVEWFNNETRLKNIMGSYLFNDIKQNKSVQVVWYEDCGKKDARDIFNEVNDLTVKLSCSELIRSLFLSSNAEFDCYIDMKGINEETQKSLQEQDKINQQRYINTKWDEIEHRLSDLRMQSFMTNKKEIGLRNNIELLFNIISQKNVGGDISKKDPLYTFIYFNDEIKKSNASKMWQTIEKYYSRLCGWMENRDYYHMVGYLNALRNDDATLSELLAFAETHKKNEMFGELNRRICISIDKKDFEQLLSLDYMNGNDYGDIKRLLFLYNVELNRRMHTQEFFPFELFKPLNTWTLEHIHAQNSDCLPTNDREVWESWSRDNAAALKTLHFKDDLEEKRNKLIVEP